MHRVTEADVLMATDALGPSNAPDDDGLETPEKILYSDLSTGAPFCSIYFWVLCENTQIIQGRLCSPAW